MKRGRVKERTRKREGGGGSRECEQGMDGWCLWVRGRKEREREGERHSDPSHAAPGFPNYFQTMACIFISVVTG